MTGPKIHYVPERKDERQFTLPKLLQTLDELDQQFIEMSPEELDVIKTKLPQKVDGVFHYLDAMNTRIKQLKERIKEIQETVKALENKQEAVEDYLASKMVEHGFDKLPGHEYTMAVRETEAVGEVDSVEFTDEFVAKYKPYIRIKYELSKEALKPDLKEGLYDIPFARKKKNHHLRFSIKRKE